MIERATRASGSPRILILITAVPAFCCLLVFVPPCDLRAEADRSVDGAAMQDIRVSDVPPPPAFKRDKEYFLAIAEKQTDQPADVSAEAEVAPGIVFVAKRESGWDAWSVNPDGSGLANLTLCAESQELSKDRYAKIYDIAWAPEERNFYFVRGPQFPPARRSVRREFWRMSADGGTKEQVATFGTATGSDAQADREAVLGSLDFLLGHRQLQPLEERSFPFLIPPDGQHRLGIFGWNNYYFLYLQDNGRSRRVEFVTDPNRLGLDDKVDLGTGLDDGVIVRLPFSTNNLRGFVGDPWRMASWSPDSRSIVFNSAGYCHLLLLERDLSAAKILFLRSDFSGWIESTPKLVFKTTDKEKLLDLANFSKHVEECEAVPLQVRTVEPSWLNEVGYPHAPIKWSADGSYLAFFADRKLDPNKRERQIDFVVVRLADNRVAVISNRFGAFYSESYRGFSFSPDGRSFAVYLVGPREDPTQTVKEEEMVLYVASLEELFTPAPGAPAGPRLLIEMEDERLKPIARGAGESLLWVGPGREEEDVALELVVPADSEQRGELASTKSRHAALERRLADLERKWRAGKQESVLDEIRDAVIDIQVEESSFFELACEAIDDFSYAEIDRQAAAFRKRSVYLQRRTATAYDRLRTYSYSLYVTSFRTYLSEESFYRLWLRHSLNTLNLWNAYNAFLLKRSGLTARETELALLKARFSGDPGEYLRNLCHRTALLHLDQMERSLVTGHLLREAAFHYQRSYLNGIRAAIERQRDIETTTTAEEATRLLFAGSQYLLSSMGAGWSAFVDLLKTTYIPSQRAREWLGVETLAESVDRQIVATREATLKQLNVVDQVRAFSIAQFIELRHFLREEGGFSPVLEERLRLLLENRNLHDDTDGGLYRVAGAFDTTLVDRLTTEYTAALRHARLNLRDLRTAINMQIGLDAESGDFTFRIFLDPMKLVESLSRSWRGEWDIKGDYLGDREGLVERMYLLFTFWRDRGYAFEEFETRRDVPIGDEGEQGIGIEVPTQTWLNHMEMAQALPEYIDFLLRRDALIHDSEQLRLEAQTELAETSREREELQHLHDLNELIFPLTLRTQVARQLRLEGIDQIFCRNYTGGLAKLTQASRADPEVMNPQQLELIKRDLTWMRIKETGIDTFREIGNNVFYSLLLGRITGGMGIGVPGQQVGFLECVWRYASPFDGASSVNGLFRIWLNATKLIASRAVAGATVKALDAVGADGESYRPYLDQLAIALVDLGSQQLITATYPYLNAAFGRIARELKDVAKSLDDERRADEVDITGEARRQTLRQWLIDYLDVVKRLKSLADLSSQMEREFALRAAGAAVRRGEYDSIREYLYQRTKPVTWNRIQRSLQRYRGATTAGFNVEAAVELFQEAPIKKLRDFKRNRSYFDRFPAIEQEIDSVRCRLAQHGRSKVVEQYGRWIEIVAPSGTPLGNAEYRHLDSDSDYTFLLRHDTPPEIRSRIEGAFVEHFRGQFGLSEEQIGVMLDANTFADMMPRPDLIGDATEWTAQFIRNTRNPERYIMPCGVRFIPQFLFRKAGVAERVVDGRLVTMTPEEVDRAFGHIVLRPHMALGIIIDQFRSINRYWKKYKEGKIDGAAFVRAQGKFNLRALLGNNISSEEGARLQNDFMPSQENTLHRSIRDIAQQLGSSDDTITLLAREWYALKVNRSMEEVFAERMRFSGLGLREAARQHVEQSRAAMRSFIERAQPIQEVYVRQQGELMREMQRGAEIETLLESEEYRRVEFEYYSEVVAHAWLLNNFQPEEMSELVDIAPNLDRYIHPANPDVGRLARYYQMQRREEER